MASGSVAFAADESAPARMQALHQVTVNPPISTPPVAHVDVTQPPHTTVMPGGTTAAPSSGATAVNPRNGHVLTETPAGYIDPRTGRFTPK